MEDGDVRQANVAPSEACSAQESTLQLLFSSMPGHNDGIPVTTVSCPQSLIFVAKGFVMILNACSPDPDSCASGPL